MLGTQPNRFERLLVYISEAQISSVTAGTDTSIGADHCHRKRRVAGVKLALLENVTAALHRVYQNIVGRRNFLDVLKDLEPVPSKALRLLFRERPKLNEIHPSASSERKHATNAFWRTVTVSDDVGNSHLRRSVLPALAKVRDVLCHALVFEAMASVHLGVLR